MTENTPLVRIEHLQRLGSLFRSVGRALARNGLSKERGCALMQSGVAAECVQCGIHVSGEELFALSQPSEGGKISSKVERLRLGDCARQGCDSFYYRVTFQSGAETDWAAILARAENPQEEPAAASGYGVRERMRAILSYRPRVSWRLWAALGGIALVLVARSEEHTSELQSP